MMEADEETYGQEEEDSGEEENGGFFEGEITVSLDELVGDVQYYRCVTQFRGETLGEVVRRFSDFRALKTRLSPEIVGSLKAEFPSRFTGLLSVRDVSKKRCQGLNGWLREASRRAKNSKDASKIRRFLGLVRKGTDDDDSGDEVTEQQSFLGAAISQQQKNLRDSFKAVEDMVVGVVGVPATEEKTSDDIMTPVKEEDDASKMQETKEDLVEPPSTDKKLQSDSALLERLRTELEDAGREEGRLREALAEAKNEASEMRLEIDELRTEKSDLEDAHKIESEKLRDEATELRNKNLKDKAAHQEELEKRQKEATETLKKEKEAMESLQKSEIARVREESRIALEKQEEELRRTKESLEASVEALTSELTDTLDAKAAYEASSEALEQSKKKRLSFLEAELKEARDENNQLSKDQETLRADHRQSVDALKASLASSKTNVDDLENQLAQKKKEDADRKAIEAERQAVEALRQQAAETQATRKQRSSLTTLAEVSKHPNTPLLQSKNYADSPGFADIGVANGTVNNPNIAETDGGSIGAPMRARPQKKRGFKGLFASCGTCDN